MVTKSSGLGDIVQVLPIHYDPHITEASQKHICSLLLNRCRDCTRTKTAKDEANQEEKHPHPGYKSSPRNE